MGSFFGCKNIVITYFVENKQVKFNLNSIHICRCILKIDASFNINFINQLIKVINISRYYKAMFDD